MWSISPRDQASMDDGSSIIKLSKKQMALNRRTLEEVFSDSIKSQFEQFPQDLVTSISEPWQCRTVTHHSCSIHRPWREVWYIGLSQDMSCWICGKHSSLFASPTFFFHPQSRNYSSYVCPTCFSLREQ
jgi:hypothetical protein